MADVGLDQSAALTSRDVTEHPRGLSPSEIHVTVWPSRLTAWDFLTPKTTAMALGNARREFLVSSAAARVLAPMENRTSILWAGQFRGDLNSALHLKWPALPMESKNPHQLQFLVA